MSEYDDAMEQHMAYIVLHENRPFSFKDFLCFEEDGKEYRMRHGTIRNKLLAFRKNGIIEPDYNSGIAFYTLAGIRFGKPMTPNHTVVHNYPVYKMLQDLPLYKRSIHDIRLKLGVPNISKMLSLNPDFRRNKRSNDIIIPAWCKQNAIVKIIIHQTDVVSVIIGCSLQPIPLDFNGIIRFFNLLVLIQAKLETLLNADDTSYLIPNYKQWIITMWHFGRDALIEYTGEKFSITIEQAQRILTRVYVKDSNGKNRIRIERQEYPKKTVAQAINEKLESLRYQV